MRGGGVAPSESEAFWPDIQAEGGDQTCGGPPHRYRSLDLKGADVVAAARPSLMQLRGGPGRRKTLRATCVGPLGAVAATAYVLLGAGFAFLLVSTQSAQPLFPLATDSLEWSRGWLKAAAADYLGVCLCLCGVIACSEPPGQAVCWTLGCCLLGSPVSCLYVAARILRHRTLSLRRAEDT